MEKEVRRKSWCCWIFDKKNENNVLGEEVIQAGRHFVLQVGCEGQPSIRDMDPSGRRVGCPVWFSSHNSVSKKNSKSPKDDEKWLSIMDVGFLSTSVPVWQFFDGCHFHNNQSNSQFGGLLVCTVRLKAAVGCAPEPQIVKPSKYSNLFKKKEKKKERKNIPVQRFLPNVNFKVSRIPFFLTVAFLVGLKAASLQEKLFPSTVSTRHDTKRHIESKYSVWIHWFDSFFDGCHFHNFFVRRSLFIVPCARLKATFFVGSAPKHKSSNMKYVFEAIGIYSPQQFLTSARFS